MANDLKTIYTKETAAATAKAKPAKLSSNKDLSGQFAYDPYVKEENVTDTYEKTQGAKITLDKTTASIAVGGNVTLKATVSPAAIGKPVWKSSDTSVATVSSAGKVTGVKAGTATITSTMNFAGKSASCEVTVTSE